MWRLLSSISRAFKSHVHSPRPSAGLYVEEEQEALEIEKSGCPFLHRKRRSLHCQEPQHGCRILNSLFVSKKNKESGNTETTCRINQSQGANTGQEHGDKKRWSCHHDFWRMFQGSNRVLEALSWGSAILMGTDGEKRRHKSRLLLRVLLTSPGHNITTVRAINNSVSATNTRVLQTQETGHTAVHDRDDVTRTASDHLDTDLTLDSALEEFQFMCSEYTAKTESLLGIEAAGHGDFSTAVEHLHSSCALGNTSACFNLGLCYETGSGVKQDLVKAKHYYDIAASKGHSMALYNLGLLNMQCNKYNMLNAESSCCDCGCNRVLGLTLVEKAAKLGLAKAQTYLGIHHIEERHDVDAAVPYFKSAAEQNDMDAQYFLAICYEQGWGVKVNQVEAAQLYSLATKSGHEMAMYNLAVFNEHGLGGISQNKLAAEMLYQKSADLGCEQAKQRLDDMKTCETHAADRLDEIKTSETVATEDWKKKMETFQQLYQQHHSDEITLIKHQDIKHQDMALSPSASSPNLTHYSLHKDSGFFFGNHLDHVPQKKTFNKSYSTSVNRRGSHLGSDGGYDDDSSSPNSTRSDLDGSFESPSYELVPSYGSLHKSHSQPNFSMVTFNI